MTYVVSNIYLYIQYIVCRFTERLWLVIGGRELIGVAKSDIHQL